MTELGEGPAGGLAVGRVTDAARAASTEARLGGATGVAAGAVVEEPAVTEEVACLALAGGVVVSVYPCGSSTKSSFPSWSRFSTLVVPWSAKVLAWLHSIMYSSSPLVSSSSSASFLFSSSKPRITFVFSASFLLQADR